MELFRGRWSVERLFGRAKEGLLLGCLKLRCLGARDYNVRDLPIAISAALTNG